MNQSKYFVSLALVASALGTAAFAADVGVSVNIAQPGFYGRIDIGRVPGPVLIYPQPVVIEQRTVNVVRQPIYLHVPPGHAKNWRKHCSHYQACGQPVYFVQDGWYRDVYEPRYYGDSGRRDDYRESRYDDGQRDNGKHKKGHGKH
ncbi:MAG TPA: hypothetical protein VFX90_05030 [Rhodoferax sp.]|nr:hypothetical protein [Rhodoferax sp.]